MIQAPTLTAVSGCGMHGHAFRCRVIGNSIIRNGQGFAPWETCQPAMGGGRSKLPRKRCRRTCQLLCGAAEICQRVVAAAEAWPASAPSTNTNGRPTARHAMLNRRLAVKSRLLKAHQHHAPNRRTTQRLFRGPQQIRQIRPVNMNELCRISPTIGKASA